MRLISVDKFRLEDFTEPDLPEYGILSHTWEGEEAKYDDFIGASLAEIQSMGKYHKIRGCARLATLDNLKYIWVDTCCINKSSSAELQEAINSMYRWYSKAKICYVYLSDHSPGDFQLSGCKWVTRGWTLQELIAPSIVQFHASDWSVVGNKRDDIDACASATGIDSEILLSGEHSSASVAQKMSWASNRKCTRLEDIAYSLMGLFDIHMPMLYGEGEKAFIRLQEEIIKSTFDMSVFAWIDQNADNTSYCGLLALSPAYFGSCAKITSRTTFENGRPYSMTNLGVHLQSVLHPLDSEAGEYKMRLMNVKNYKHNRWSELALHLNRVSPQSNQFVRTHPHELIIYEGSQNQKIMKPEEIYVRQCPVIPKSHLTTKPDRISFSLTTSVISEMRLQNEENFILHVWPHSAWLESEHTILIKPSRTVTLAALWYSIRRNNKYEDVRVVFLSFERRSGRRRISVHNGIPIDIGEVELERAIFQSISSTSGATGSSRDNPLYQSKETNDSVITSSFDALLVNGKVTLLAKVDEWRYSVD